MLINVDSEPITATSVRLANFTVRELSNDWLVLGHQGREIFLAIQGDKLVVDLYAATNHNDLPTATAICE